MINRPLFGSFCLLAVVLAACSGGGSSSSPSPQLISGISTGAGNGGVSTTSASSGVSTITYVASGNASAGCGSSATPTPTSPPGTTAPSGSKIVTVDTCPSLPAGTVLYTITTAAGTTSSGTAGSIINYFASGQASAGCGSSATPTPTAPPGAVPAPGTNIWTATCPVFPAGSFLYSINPSSTSGSIPVSTITYVASGNASAGCGSTATPTPTSPPGTTAPSGAKIVTIDTCPALAAGSVLYTITTAGGSTGSGSNTGIVNYFANGQSSCSAAGATPTPTTPPNSVPAPGLNVYESTCPAETAGTFLGSQNASGTAPSPTPAPTATTTVAPTATSTSTSSSGGASPSPTATSTSTSSGGGGSVSIAIPTPQPSSTASPMFGTPFFQNGAGFGNCGIGLTFTSEPGTATLSVTESGYSGTFVAVSSIPATVSASEVNNVLTLQAMATGSVTITVTDQNTNHSTCNVTVN